VVIAIANMITTKADTLCIMADLYLS